MLNYLDLSRNELSRQDVTDHTFEGPLVGGVYQPLPVVELNLGYNE